MTLVVVTVVMLDRDMVEMSVIAYLVQSRYRHFSLAPLGRRLRRVPRGAKEKCL